MYGSAWGVPAAGQEIQGPAFTVVNGVPISIMYQLDPMPKRSAIPANSPTLPINVKIAPMAVRSRSAIDGAGA